MSLSKQPLDLEALKAARRKVLNMPGLDTTIGTHSQDLTDYLTLLTANAPALIEAAEEAERQREALQQIRTSTFGQVCDEYDICTHRACRASYTAWATAVAALERSK